MDDPRIGLFSWEIAKGDTETLSCQYADDEGNPEPLTGCEIQCEFRNRPGGKLLAGFDSTHGITINESDGLFEIRIEAEETADYDFKYAWYDVKLKNADGDIRTLFNGKITVIEAVTVWDDGGVP